MIIKEIQAQLRNANAPIVKVLHRVDSVNIIALGLKAGIILKEHTTKVPAKLLILQGSVKYLHADETILLNIYDELAIPVNVPHSVEGVDDAICLLIH